jgi:oxygen-independent coproporphyrinogen-3 oxidase
MASGLGIYVHIPFCKRKCLYCDFCSQELGAEREYIDCHISEIKSQSVHFKERKIKTLYFGGGTPSALPHGMLGEAVRALSDYFDLDTVERSIEGNPESLTREKLWEIKDCGFDRVSVGVQSLDDRVLRSIGRLHDSKTALSALYDACEIFDNVSADIMVGLPYQSTQSAVETAKTIAGLKVKHISCYALTLEQNTPLYAMAQKGELSLPDNDASAQAFSAVLDTLSDLGFSRYEVSNFAKDGRQCVHNLGYWKREEYLGLGASAHSFCGGTRFSNVSNVQKYIETVKNNRGKTLHAFAENVQILTEKDIKFEKLMLGLRLTEGVPKDYFKGYENTLLKFRNYFEEKENGNISLNPRGFEVMNSILCEFLD